MPYIRCRTFTIDENKKESSIFLRPCKNDYYAIKCEPSKNAPTNFDYAVVNIEINRNALVTWLENNPSIAGLVDVVSPRSVNEEVGNYYLNLLLRYQHTIGRDKIINRLNESDFDDYKLRRDFMSQQTKKKDSLVFPRKKKDDKKNQG